MTGFQLKWEIIPPSDKGTSSQTQSMTVGSRTKVKGSQPNYRNNDFSEVVQLAKHLRLWNMTRKEMVKKIIQAKVQNTTFLLGNVCSGRFFMSIVRSQILRVFGQPHYVYAPTAPPPPPVAPPPPPPPVPPFL